MSGRRNLHPSAEWFGLSWYSFPGFFFRWSHNCRHIESWWDPTERRGHVFNQIHSMTLILWHLHCSFSFEVMAELSHPDQRFLLEKFLEDINVPTLTLWGDKDKVRRNTFDWDVWNMRISCLYTPQVPTVQELVSTSFPGSSLFPPKREWEDERPWERGWAHFTDLAMKHYVSSKSDLDWFIILFWSKQ